MPKTGSVSRSRRFQQPASTFVEEFTASVDFDQRLFRHDIQASIAHANMLATIGVLSAEEHADIIDGLRSIEREIDDGEFRFDSKNEDVHMNIEARLVEKVGDTGKKLHTARSRNDQVATDIRLWLRDETNQVIDLTTEVLRSIIELAEPHSETVMPGFTHLQAAQPISFAHHIMAWFEMLYRDRQRFVDSLARMNVSPLGAAALAGTSFPIDRHATALELGFDDVCRNSIDAVSDRDFVIEFLFAASLTATHLSRWCEEIIFWNSTVVDFIELPDEFCTGSSIMPQKKNPDIPELIRGKCSRIIGNLVGVLVLMKGQPLAYNRDNQEDKEPLFDSVDSLKGCLVAMRDLIPKMAPNTTRMRSAAEDGFSTATDLADWLVRNGMPFRDAHHIVGRIVSHAESANMKLHELDLHTLRQFEPSIDESAREALSVEGSMSSRRHIGGTSASSVQQAINDARERIET